MNRLSTERKRAILAALVEGCSIRGTQRMTGADKKTITRLLVRVGEGCAGMMDDRMRDLDCYNLQIDEVWSYVGKKQGRLSDDERREGMKGDQYVFVALDADTKLVPSWRVGPRNMDTTLAFMRDLDSRLRCRPQITTDGFSPYQLAVPFVFSGNVDFATEVKTGIIYLTQGTISSILLFMRVRFLYLLAQLTPDGFRENLPQQLVTGEFLGLFGFLSHRVIS